jgi:hypothetical protein
MNENVFRCALLALFVLLSACGAATHSPVVARGSMAVQAGATAMQEPQAPFDMTPITPVESAGAARME